MKDIYDMTIEEYAKYQEKVKWVELWYEYRFLEDRDREYNEKMKKLTNEAHK